jgi:serine/threonine-protein kinase
MENPEAQYRYAQLRAAPGDLAAAWLAVAGYYPRSEWTSPAYLQLGRVLYRERDGDRVAALARDIDGWKSKQTRDEELVEALETAEALLRRDLDGVIERVNRIVSRTDRPVSDPGLIDFCVEIVSDALKIEPGPGATGQAVLRPKLTTIRFRLLDLLHHVRSLDLAVR